MLRVTSLFNTGVSFDEQTKSGDTNPRNERASQSKLKWERANGVSSSTARAQLPSLPSVGHHSCPSRHLVRGAGTRHRLGRNSANQDKEFYCKKIVFVQSSWLKRQLAK